MKRKKIENEPFDIYIDPKATHLFPRWWHKFIFWKKFVYPEWTIRTKRMSFDQLNKK